MSSSRVNLESYLIPLDEINRATGNFSQERCIGGGGFGAVYKGHLSERWQNRTAAIKRLSQDSYQGEREFRNELEMISVFHHENIISFIGYCDEGSEMIIVYEYAANGSLDQHLRDPNKMRCITWIQRLKICIGAARGLYYLHSGLGEHNRVIHRDVKSANILLDDNLVGKICDFGLSKVGRKNLPNTQPYTKVAGTQFYLDPAYHESRILRKESDVYSFGVVLFEMLSGMLVYSERSIEDDKPEILMTFVRRYDHKELHKLIDQDIRFQIDIRSFDTFIEIAYLCISFSFKERPTMATVMERIEEALNIQENAGSFIERVIEDMGFSHGKPIAAVTIYKCLLKWNYFEAERTTMFDQLIQFFGPQNDDQDNNDKMAYWLSLASTLLFLMQKSLKLHDASSAPKPPPPAASLFGRLTMGLRPSITSVYNAELKVEQQVEGKYPAFLFKQQLTAYLEKIYVIIIDNLKKELGPLLGLCIMAPRISISETTLEPLRSHHLYGEDFQFNPWKGIVDRLNTLKENFVPPIIVQKIFAQIFSFINARLFNSLLLRRECCSFSNGEYVKAGLEELELWCSEAKKEYTGSACEELEHVREAIGFLTKHLKQTISYYEISNDLCPILSVRQLYRICTLYSDDKFYSQSVSRDVITRMRTQMVEDSDSGSGTSFLLEDSSSIPLSVDDLFTSLQVEDFEEVKAVVELAKYGAFHLMTGRKRIMFGHGIP